MSATRWEDRCRTSLPDQTLRRWNDTPEPGGFAPCPNLIALRAPASAEEISIDPLAAGARALHHAPGRLIFRSIEVDALLRLDGVGMSPLEVLAPRSPVRVRAVPVLGSERREVTGEIRSIHLDADTRRVLVVHAHTLIYPRERVPGWLHVAAAA